MSEVKECRLCQRLVQPEREPVGCLRASVVLLLAVPTFGLTLLVFLFQPQRCPICHSNQLRKPVSKEIPVGRNAQISAQEEAPKFLAAEKGGTETSGKWSAGEDNKGRGQSLLVSTKPRSLAPLWISIAVLFALGLSLIVGTQKKEQERTIPPSSPQKSLIEAAGNGDIAAVQTLLANEANPNEKDNFGTTALMFAARSNHIAIVQMLLDKGADVHAKNSSGETALRIAWDKGHTQVMQLLAQASVVGMQSPLIVAVDKANMRSGPGERYGTIGYGKGGDSFAVKGQEGEWYKVDYQG